MSDIYLPGGPALHFASRGDASFVARGGNLQNVAEPQKKQDFARVYKNQLSPQIWGLLLKAGYIDTYGYINLNKFNGGLEEFINRFKKGLPEGVTVADDDINKAFEVLNAVKDKDKAYVKVMGGRHEAPFITRTYLDVNNLRGSALWKFRFGIDVDYTGFGSSPIVIDGNYLGESTPWAMIVKPKLLINNVFSLFNTPVDAAVALNVFLEEYYGFSRQSVLGDMGVGLQNIKGCPLSQYLSVFSLGSLGTGDNAAPAPTKFAAKTKYEITKNFEVELGGWYLPGDQAWDVALGLEYNSPNVAIRAGYGYQAGPTVGLGLEIDHFVIDVSLSAPSAPSYALAALAPQLSLRYNFGKIKKEQKPKVPPIQVKTEPSTPPGEIPPKPEQPTK